MSSKLVGFTASMNNHTEHMPRAKVFSSLCQYLRHSFDKSYSLVQQYKATWRACWPSLVHQCINHTSPTRRWSNVSCSMSRSKYCVPDASIYTGNELETVRRAPKGWWCTRAGMWLIKTLFISLSTGSLNCLCLVNALSDGRQSSVKWTQHSISRRSGCSITVLEPEIMQYEIRYICFVLH